MWEELERDYYVKDNSCTIFCPKSWPPCPFSSYTHESDTCNSHHFLMPGSQTMLAQKTRWNAKEVSSNCSLPFKIKRIEFKPLPRLVKLFVSCYTHMHTHTLASFTALFRVEKVRNMERKLMMINMASNTVSKPTMISKESAAEEGESILHTDACNLIFSNSLAVSSSQTSACTRRARLRYACSDQTEQFQINYFLPLYAGRPEFKLVYC